MKTALITGITGQDGSYLAEFLLEKGFPAVTRTVLCHTSLQAQAPVGRQSLPLGRGTAQWQLTRPPGCRIKKAAKAANWR